MSEQIKCGDGRTVYLVSLDRVTERRLLEITDGQPSPSLVIAAIIHDVLEDDAMAHSERQKQQQGDNHGEEA